MGVNVCGGKTKVQNRIASEDYDSQLVVVKSIANYIIGEFMISAIDGTAALFIIENKIRMIHARHVCISMTELHCMCECVSDDCNVFQTLHLCVCVCVCRYC